MKKFLLILIILNFSYGCGSVGEGFTLKKSNTGDEFLVEKKNPLVMPPNFKELPEPGNMDSIEQSEQNSFGIEDLANDNSSNKDSVELGNNSTKEFILKNIKKNESN